MSAFTKPLVNFLPLDVPQQMGRLMYLCFEVDKPGCKYRSCHLSVVGLGQVSKTCIKYLVHGVIIRIKEVGCIMQE